MATAEKLVQRNLFSFGEQKLLTVQKPNGLIGFEIVIDNFSDSVKPDEIIFATNRDDYIFDPSSNYLPILNYLIYKLQLEDIKESKVKEQLENLEMVEKKKCYLISFNPDFLNNVDADSVKKFTQSGNYTDVPILKQNKTPYSSLLNDLLFREKFKARFTLSLMDLLNALSLPIKNNSGKRTTLSRVTQIIERNKRKVPLSFSYEVHKDIEKISFYVDGVKK